MENQTDEILELDLESNDYLKTPIKNTSISVNSILDNKTVNIKNHKIIKIWVCDDRDFFILQYKHIFKDLNIKVQVWKFVYTFWFDICIEEKKLKRFNFRKKSYRYKNIIFRFGYANYELIWNFRKNKIKWQVIIYCNFNVNVKFKKCSWFSKIVSRWFFIKTFKQR